MRDTPTGEPGGWAMSDERAALRSELRARRRAVGRSAALAARAAVAEALSTLPELGSASAVATYLPADGELDPNGAVDRWRSEGRSVHLPTIVSEVSLSFEPWGPGTAMRENRYGMSEPVPSPAAVNADVLDAVLVPCVAVDPDGNRLGFGAGYYDRALASATRPVVVGIAWDDAVVAHLDPRPWDVPMHVIVTERRVIRPPRRDPGTR